MPMSSESDFEEGLALFNDRRYDKAIVKFREVIDQNPDLSEAHHFLGRSFMEEKRRDDAMGEFCEAIRKNPRDGNSRYRLAVILLEKDQVSDALPLLTEAVQLAPAMFYQFSGKILEELQRTSTFSETEHFFKQCRDIFDEHARSVSPAQELMISYAHLQGALGQLYFSRGLLNGAVLQYREAIRLAPKESAFHGKLADMYFITDLNMEAVAEYHAALIAKPADAAIHKKLGDALVKSRQFIDAFNEYREAVRLEPRNEYYLKVYDQFRTFFLDNEGDKKTEHPVLSPRLPANSTPLSYADEAFQAIIAGGESERVEYKSTALWSKFFSKGDIAASDSKDVHKFGRDASRFIIAKTIAGFLNTNGGNLVIGVRENKAGMPDEIIGIDHEYPKLKDPCSDGYRRMIVDDIVRTYLPSEIFHHLNEYITMHFPKVQDKTLCWLEIKKADDGVFLKTRDEEFFFIRIDAETRQISDRALVDYCRRQFG